VVKKNKKLNKSNFKDLLSTINDMSMEEQDAFFRILIQQLETR
jgi:hypothetical protein